MTPIEIRDVVEKAARTTRVLRITGYTASDGSVADYTVQLIGSEGYRALVKASIDAIGHGTLEATNDVEREALKELRESWGKTLAGAHTSRNFSDKLVDLGQGWTRSETHPELTVITNMLRVLKTEKRAAAEKPNARGSSPKTLAKDKFTKAAALGLYLGRLNLGPGNVVSVAVGT